jgi:hypothetical protein
MQHAEIAQIAHAADRAYTKLTGGTPSPHWDALVESDKQALIEQVQEILKHEDPEFDGHPAHPDPVQDKRGALFHNIVLSLMDQGE